jgi:hypothetical protein
MELRCDGFEVVRTKGSVGFDECLKKLEDARHLLMGKTSRSAILTYDSYTIAHEREKEQRKKNKTQKRIHKYEIEKERRLQLKFQGQKNKLDKIKEQISPRDKYSHNDMEENTFTFGEKMVKSKETMEKERKPFRSTSRQKQRGSPNYKRDQISLTEAQSTSWLGSFLPLFKSSSNSIIHEVESARRQELNERSEHLSSCSVPLTVSVPTGAGLKSLPASRAKYDCKLRMEPLVDETEVTQTKDAQTLPTKTEITVKGVKKNEVEQILLDKSVTVQKAPAHFLPTQFENKENGATQEMAEWTLPFISMITDKRNLPWSGSYCTTESSTSKSVEMARPRSESLFKSRLSMEVLREKAHVILVNSKSNVSSSTSLYSDHEPIEFEETENPVIIYLSKEASKESTVSPGKIGSYESVSKLDRTQSLLSNIPCNSEMECESSRDKINLTHRTSFPRPPRSPSHKSNESPRGKNPSFQSNDSFVMVSSVEPDKNEVITFEDNCPRGIVQLIHKTRTGTGSHMDSTIKTTSLEDDAMDNLIITFSSGSITTEDEHRADSRGSVRKRLHSDDDMSRDDCSSFEPFDRYTIADRAPLDAFVGAEMTTEPVTQIRF